MPPSIRPERADVVVVGAGHNGLVAATLLARAGLDVVVLEAAEVLGGACRTESPFTRAPGLRASTGAYLLGLMPPELLALLGVDLPLIRRDPHYFLPSRDGRALLLGNFAHQQIARVLGTGDANAATALATELAALRDDLAPAWLVEPRSVEETAERYLRPKLREVFVDLVRGSATDYLSRFDFTSPLLPAMYAVTDALPGLAGPPSSPGSGHNLLVHSMCRLPGSGGTWMAVRGGMGTVTAQLAEAARRAGAGIFTQAPVAAVLLDSGCTAGVLLGPNHALYAPVVLAAIDPFRLSELVELPAAIADRVEDWRARPGRTLKVNLALSGPPRFSALPDDRGPHATTVHLLPGGGLAAIEAAYADALAGRLPDAPPIEWYQQGALDASLRDDAGRHSSALFVQGVPHEVAGSSWALERDGYVEHLLGVVESWAPGTRELVVEANALAPPDIAAHFGIVGGNIHHVDNSVSFTDRMPYATGIAGLYAGAAGCHPAGSVIGCAGHNAAQCILADLGLPPAG